MVGGDGEVKPAGIHVQNLAPGTKVSLPEEAHSRQVGYTYRIQ
jgi:hypothetical protein